MRFLHKLDRSIAAVHLRHATPFRVARPCRDVVRYQPEGEDGSGKVLRKVPNLPDYYAATQSRGPRLVFHRRENLKSFSGCSICVKSVGG
jgi:hypothetical protein